MNLTFNSKHSMDDIGLRMRSKVRHILPEPKTAFEDLPGVDGEYDFTDVNPDGRTKYKPFTEEIVFSMIEANSAAVRVKAKQVADWLACGEQQLIYEDEPDVYYLARVINRMDIENQLIKLKTFTAQFKCRPYGFALSEVSETYSGIVAPENKVISNPGIYVKPKITITGSFTTLTLTVGTKTLSYSEALSAAEIVIDCDDMSCIKDGSTNKNNKLSGSFFELENGNNTLEIGGTGLNCDVTVSFRPRYR